ncbi:MAG: OsmC family protein [Pseudonocardiaceae bacterium]
MVDQRFHRYRAVCSWSGSTAQGYESYLRSHQGSCPPAGVTVELSSAPSFRGDAALLNPEQLVVLAAASCQLLSFLAVAARVRIDIRRYIDEATAVMVEEGTRGRITAITLRPRITLAPGPGPDRLHRLVQLAHEQCYIANTLNCPVTVDPTFEILDGHPVGD